MNPRTAEIAAVAQVVGSVGMFGVIWIVQIVHYPLMRFISGQQFARFESEHRTRISRVVGPLMAVEGVCVELLGLLPQSISHGQYRREHRRGCKPLQFR